MNEGCLYKHTCDAKVQLHDNMFASHEQALEFAALLTRCASAVFGRLHGVC